MQRLYEWVSAYWIPLTTVILISIIGLSLTPLPALPPVPGSDKTHHFIAYGVLMLPVAIARPRLCLLLGFVFLSISGAIELIQPYVNRYGEWLDLLANAAGLMIGWLSGKLANRYYGQT